MYKEYADVILLIKSLEEKRDEMKERILEDLRNREGEKNETEYGQFYIVRRNSWTYSPKLQKMKDEIKSKEIDEQEKGIAKVKVSESVTFRQNNDK